jgi:hypothetical protein
MWQQIIALILILFFLSNLIKQRKNRDLKKNEFILWLSFWSLGALAIIFIKELDKLVANLGFSGTGINLLLYLSLFTLFYLVFRLRLKIAKLDNQITKIVREITLNR